MKNNSIQILKQLKSSMNRFKLKIDIQQNIVKSEIKQYYEQNKIPPSALLMRWKQMRTLQEFADNSIYSIGTQLQIAEVSDSLKNALGSKVQENMAKLQSQVEKAQNAINSFVSIQQGLLENNLVFTQTMEAQNQITENSINQDNIAREVLEIEENEDEALIFLAQDDPEFLDTLPPDKKNLIKEKMKT